MSDEMPGDWSQVNDYTFHNDYSNDQMYLAMRPDTESIILCFNSEVYDEVSTMANGLSTMRDLMAKHPIGVDEI